MLAIAGTVGGVVLGALFGYELSKRREAWIRRLNSRQDFYQEALGLVDLLASGVNLPAEYMWGRISAATKAAYDGAFFGLPAAIAEEMRSVVLELARRASGEPEQTVTLEALRTRIRALAPTGAVRDQDDPSYSEEVGAVFDDGQPTSPTQGQSPCESPASSGRVPQVGWLDADADVNAPASPFLFLLLLPIVLPSLYALTHGADPLAVGGLVAIAMGGLLAAPELFTKSAVAAAEAWWARSPWTNRQRRLGRTLRTTIKYSARGGLVTLPLGLGLAAAAIVFDSTPLAYVAGYTLTAFTVVGLPALVGALLLAGGIRRRRRGGGAVEPPITLSEAFAAHAADPRWLAAGLALLLIGLAAQVLAAIP
jgi:hypothetical protein